MKLIACLIFCALTTGTAAHAEKPAPTRLSELDLTRLKLAITTRELAQQQAQRAVEQANATIAASDTEIDKICKDYRIDRAQLDHSVNAKTGEIIRDPGLLAPKAEKPVKK